MAERIVGIDFGTSTSVIRVARYENGALIGDVMPVTFNEGSTMTPTLVQRIGERTVFGFDARIPKRNAELFQNFKIDLESDDEAVRKQAYELTAEFIGWLYKVYAEQSAGGHLGDSSDEIKTIISYPVKWKKESKQFMQRTAREAGFANVWGMDEARAAIRSVMARQSERIEKFDHGAPLNLLLIDMGAGTTDLVLCRYSPGSDIEDGVETLSTWPKTGDILFGGGEIDRLLHDDIERMVAKATDEETTGRIMKGLNFDKFKTWKETIVAPALLNGEIVSDFYDLYDRLTQFELDDKVDVQYTRTGFENLAGDYLHSFPELVRGCLEEAGIKGDEIDIVLLTGGHSQWYFVPEILRGQINGIEAPGLKKIEADADRIIQIALPQETVALGLVYTGWKSLLPRSGQGEKTDRAEKEFDDSGSKLEQKVDESIKDKILSKDKSITLSEVLHKDNITEKSIKNIPIWESLWNRPADPRQFYLKSIGQYQMLGFSRRYGNFLNFRNELISEASDNDPNGYIYTDDYKAIIGEKFIEIVCFGGDFWGLMEDGRLKCVRMLKGIPGDGSCNIARWKDIRYIKEERGAILGIKSDGSVIIEKPGLYFDKELNEYCSHWRNIVDVSYDPPFGITGLQENGNIVSNLKPEQAELLDNFKNIVKFSGRLTSSFFGLRNDGKMSVVSNNNVKKEIIQEWIDVVDFVTTDSNNRIAALKKDGTVAVDKLSGEAWVGTPERWENIISITSVEWGLIKSHYAVFGLHRSGKVSVAGVGNISSFEQVNRWEKIIAIQAYGDRDDAVIYGITEDGRILVTGNKYRKNTSNGIAAFLGVGKTESCTVECKYKLF